MADIERTGIAQQEFNRWEADARLVEQESERDTAGQKAFLALEDALTEWDAYLHSLPLEAHETAINGLREYMENFNRDRDIDNGWHKNL